MTAEIASHGPTMGQRMFRSALVFGGVMLVAFVAAVRFVFDDAED